jgi:uncharacterized membrane protein (UPF0127 family)
MDDRFQLGRLVERIGRNALLYRIANPSRNTAVCNCARVADTFATRLIGMLGKRTFSPEDGLLLKPCSSVHTLGMTFSIDAIALDRNLRVLAIRINLNPRQFAHFDPKTHCVLELPAGQSVTTGVCVGDQLLLSKI